MMWRVLLIASAFGLMTLVVACSTTEPEPVEEPTSEPVGPRVLHVDLHLTDPHSDLCDDCGTGEHAFVPDTLSFNVGDEVTFDLIGGNELHTFTVDELSIDEIVMAHEVKTITIILDKPGTFTVICVPHEAQEMVGTIHVT